MKIHLLKHLKLANQFFTRQGAFHLVKHWRPKLCHELQFSILSSSMFLYPMLQCFHLYLCRIIITMVSSWNSTVKCKHFFQKMGGWLLVWFSPVTAAIYRTRFISLPLENLHEQKTSSCMKTNLISSIQMIEELSNEFEGKANFFLRYTSIILDRDTV